jgi:hypothetical protein
MKPSVSYPCKLVAVHLVEMSRVRRRDDFGDAESRSSAALLYRSRRFDALLVR